MRAAERAADVRALGTALRYNSSLTELELASAPLETFAPEDMRTLAEGIRAHGAFTAVTLDGKTASGAGAWVAGSAAAALRGGRRGCGRGR